MKKRIKFRKALLLGYYMLIILFASTSYIYAQNGTAEYSPTGIWLSAKGLEKIKIYEVDGKIYGKIIWLKEEYDEEGNIRVDSKNHIEALRLRPIVGIEILYDFKYSGKGVLIGGKIYDPASGKTYKARIKLIDDKTAKVRGYVGTPLLGRTEICTKVLQ